MKIFYFELFGLIGFFISGLIFIVSGLRSGDYLAVSGSIIWTVACLLWLIPVLSRRNSQDQKFRNRSFLIFLVSKTGFHGIIHCIQQLRGFRLVGTFNANRKTLAKIEGIFCYNLCWVGCHLMTSTEENEGSFNLSLKEFSFFLPMYELNCQRPVR